jgi:hypothetical protein
MGNDSSKSKDGKSSKGNKYHGGGQATGYRPAAQPQVCARAVPGSPSFAARLFPSEPCVVRGGLQSRSLAHHRVFSRAPAMDCSAAGSATAPGRRRQQPGGTTVKRTRLWQWSSRRSPGRARAGGAAAAGTSSAAAGTAPVHRRREHTRLWGLGPEPSARRPQDRQWGEAALCGGRQTAQRGQAALWDRTPGRRGAAGHRCLDPRSADVGNRQHAVGGGRRAARRS